MVRPEITIGGLWLWVQIGDRLLRLLVRVGINVEGSGLRLVLEAKGLKL